jgi:hypothetical protein
MWPAILCSLNEGDVEVGWSDEGEGEGGGFRGGLILQFSWGSLTDFSWIIKVGRDSALPSGRKGTTSGAIRAGLYLCGLSACATRNRGSPVPQSLVYEKSGSTGQVRSPLTGLWSVLPIGSLEV